MADNGALAVNGKHFYLHRRRDHAAGEVQRVLAHRITQGDALRAAHRQSLLAGVGLADGLL